MFQFHFSPSIFSASPEAFLSRPRPPTSPTLSSYQRSVLRCDATYPQSPASGFNQNGKKSGHFPGRSGCSANSLTHISLLICSELRRIASPFLRPSSSQWKTDIIKSKAHVSMVTAVPACIVWAPTCQAADSGTKTLGWRRNFSDSRKSFRDGLHGRDTAGNWGRSIRTRDEQLSPLNTFSWINGMFLVDY